MAHLTLVLKIKYIQMKLFHTSFSLIIAYLLCSCTENVLENEQYKKEIYIIGAYDRVLPLDVNYNTDYSETFFTVSSSGSLNVDKNVTVKMGIDEEIVHLYNQKFWGILNLDKYYKPLSQESYNIPTLENTVIEAQKEIYTRVPIQINTSLIHPDSSYVIPVRILEVSEYEVNRSGEKVLLLLNMINSYAGNCKMDGTKSANNETPKKIQKNKNLKAIAPNAVRLFFGTENESQEVIDSKGIVITVLDEMLNETCNKVEVSAWNSALLSDGSGYYDTINRQFNITYSITTGNTITEYNEMITLPKKTQY